MELSETDIRILDLLDRQPNLRAVEIAATLIFNDRTVHRRLTPLEMGEYVTGEYSRTISGKQPVTIKKYKITTKGKRMLKGREVPTTTAGTADIQPGKS